MNRKPAPEPLKILHIGNIANNAYYNAKLLNQAGMDCDVICPEMLWALSSPEWEDADFSGSVNHTKPDWRNVDLHGFTRPGWFAQGPTELCLRYLTAKRQGDMRHSQRYWRYLQYANSIAFPQTRRDRLRAWLALRYFNSKWKWNILLFDKNALEKLKRLLKKNGLPPLIAQLLSIPIKLLQLAAIPCRLCWTAQPYKLGSFASLFKRAFPARRDALRATDMLYYTRYLKRWRSLFSHYDIVIGYATDAVWPMLSGIPYIAMEHGTLREIPFIPNSLGRLTALAYHQAEHVFVTNVDCLPNAALLAGERVSLINHPYVWNSEAAKADYTTDRARICQQLQADFLLFFPSRHDWQPGTRCADKASDVFLRAFCQLRQQGRRIGLICCRWGADIKASQALLAQAGCSEHVLWVNPLNLRQFQRMVKTCDVTADQFKVGTFGGVTFKAMAIGAAVCIYLNEAAIKIGYAELPPVINCRTQNEIVAALQPYIANRSRLVELGQAAKDWMEKYHAPAATVTAQLDRFRTFMNQRQSSRQNVRL